MYVDIEMESESESESDSFATELDGKTSSVKFNNSATIIDILNCVQLIQKPDIDFDTTHEFSATCVGHRYRLVQT